MVNARAIGMGAALLAGAGAVLALGGRGSGSSGSVIAMGTMDGMEVAIAGTPYGSIAAYRKDGATVVVGGAFQINTAADGSVTCLEIQGKAPAMHELKLGASVSLGDSVMNVDSLDSIDVLPKTLLGGSTDHNDCPTGLEESYFKDMVVGDDAEDESDFEALLADRKLGVAPHSIPLDTLLVSFALITALDDKGVNPSAVGLQTWGGECKQQDNRYEKNYTQWMPETCYSGDYLKIQNSNGGAYDCNGINAVGSDGYSHFGRIARARIAYTHSSLGAGLQIVHTNSYTQHMGRNGDGHYTQIGYLTNEQGVYPAYRMSPLDGGVKFYNKSFALDLDLTKECILAKYAVLNNFRQIDYQVGFSMGGAVVGMFRAVTGEQAKNGIRAFGSPKSVQNVQWLPGVGITTNLGCSNPGLRFLKKGDMVTGSMSSIASDFHHDVSHAQQCSAVCFYSATGNHCSYGLATCSQVQGRAYPHAKAGCHARGTGCGSGSIRLAYYTEVAVIGMGVEKTIVPNKAAEEGINSVMFDGPMICIRNGGTHHKTYKVNIQETLVYALGGPNDTPWCKKTGGSWESCNNHVAEPIENWLAQNTLISKGQLGDGNGSNDGDDDWNKYTDEPHTIQGVLNCPTDGTVCS